MNRVSYYLDETIVRDDEEEFTSEATNTPQITSPTRRGSARVSIIAIED